eukprot:g1707.t1
MSTKGLILAWKKDEWKQDVCTQSGDPLVRKIRFRDEIKPPERLQNVSQPGQTAIVAALKHRASGLVAIVSTMHPGVPALGYHEQLLLSRVTLDAIKVMRDEIRDGEGVDDVAVLLCGDFNSKPKDLLNRYLEARALNFDVDLTNEERVRVSTKPGDKGDGTSIAQFFQETEEEKKDHLLSNPLGRPLHRARGNDSEPFHTVITPPFKHCLDYIYYDHATLHLNSFLGPFPGDEGVRINKLNYPNKYVPSDHLWIGAQFRARMHNEDEKWLDEEQLAALGAFLAEQEHEEHVGLDLYGPDADGEEWYPGGGDPGVDESKG